MQTHSWGTTASHRSSFGEFSFRQHNQGSSPVKRNPLFKGVKIIFVHCANKEPEKPFQALRDRGVMISNTFFLDSGGKFSKAQRHYSELAFGAKNGYANEYMAREHIKTTSLLADEIRLYAAAGVKNMCVFTHMADIQELLFDLDKSLETKLWKAKGTQIEDSILIIDFGKGTFEKI